LLLVDESLKEVIHQRKNAQMPDGMGKQIERL